MESKLSKFFDDAIMEATRAVLKYPQPCKIPPIPKLAEECGEAIQAANKCIEGKGSLEAVRGELVQTVAVIIRLYIEGDETLGLPPVYTVDQGGQGNG